MNKGNKMVIPLLTSIGVGAFTYYSMRRNGQTNPFQQMTQMFKNPMNMN
ncbi:hypothetical protein SAMN05421734_10213 [Pelagirhabdus alkalitolerans]|uniref:Uncharacterized protein n=1 Tax=Pelagirhabdus alkalitolerans TaxID=1612202 RepID=A0A1G6GXK6_9BACI|nr:hypothetical protein [Pelagirhabdus alkalitolerans]SDB86752.1 hypothetical protein SAMN05421734_10213 [Pelagirhabdus alkalitolerans]